MGAVATTNGSDGGTGWPVRGGATHGESRTPGMARRLLRGAVMSSFFRAYLAPSAIAAMSCLAPLPACSSNTASAGTTSTGLNGFPLGAYDSCFSNTFLEAPGGGGGGGHGGAIVLTQDGSALGVTFGGDGGDSFEFTQTADNSATLPAGQGLAGVKLVCGELEGAPTVVKLASGSLTYNAGTLFLSVSGTAEPADAGQDCTNPGGQATFVVTCSNDVVADGGASGAYSGTGMPGSEFVGVYECSSAGNQFRPGLDSLSGGSGTLAITRKGNLLTAAYADDPFVTGSLNFVATTNNAAVPATANETMQVACSGGPVSAVPVSSSTLTTDGSSVVLSFAGIGCGGSEMRVSLLCAPVDGG